MTMPSVNISGTSHTYELTSPRNNDQLPVLVFIHGWLLSRHYWLPLVQLLQSHYQCLLYDLKGFGDSAFNNTVNTTTSQDSTSLTNHHLTDKDYSLEAYARDLDLLLQKLNIDQAWLIGHSLGGSIALWAANLSPDRVKGVICLNSGGGIYLKEEFERFRQAGKQLVKFRPQWLRYVPLMDVMFSRMMVARPLALQWGRQRIIDFLQATEEAALGALLESTTEAEVHFLPQLVSRLKQPVYFIAGKKDKVMELKYVNHLASFHQLFHQSGSNVFELDNCGHLGMLEQPEKIAAIALEILSQHQD
ncbi:MAG: alpha/beta hydrolase [Pleurocapsa sp.]